MKVTPSAVSVVQIIIFGSSVKVTLKIILDGSISKVFIAIVLFTFDTLYDLFGHATFEVPFVLIMEYAVLAISISYQAG